MFTINFSEPTAKQRWYFDVWYDKYSTKDNLTANHLTPAYEDYIDSVKRPTIIEILELMRDGKDNAHIVKTVMEGAKSRGAKVTEAAVSSKIGFTPQYSLYFSVKLDNGAIMYYSYYITNIRKA